MSAAARGLLAVSWPSEAASRRPPAGAVSGGGHPVLRLAARQFAEYFAGERTGFDLPLDLRGTPFQTAVWRSLAAIPYGCTVSYGTQAALVGRPRAARAVGSAIGLNPAPVVLPCHRVVGADGWLTGFGGGLDLKSELLRREGCKELRPG